MTNYRWWYRAPVLAVLHAILMLTICSNISTSTTTSTPRPPSPTAVIVALDVAAVIDMDTSAAQVGFLIHGVNGILGGNSSNYIGTTVFDSHVAVVNKLEGTGEERQVIDKIGDHFRMRTPNSQDYRAYPQVFQSVKKQFWEARLTDNVKKIMVLVTNGSEYCDNDEVTKRCYDSRGNCIAAVDNECMKKPKTNQSKACTFVPDEAFKHNQFFIVIIQSRAASFSMKCLASMSSTRSGRYYYQYGGVPKTAYATIYDHFADAIEAISGYTMYNATAAAILAATTAKPISTGVPVYIIIVAILLIIVVIALLAAFGVLYFKRYKKRQRNRKLGLASEVSWRTYRERFHGKVTQSNTELGKGRTFAAPHPVKVGSFVRKNTPSKPDIQAEPSFITSEPIKVESLTKQRGLRAFDRPPPRRLN